MLYTHHPTTNSSPSAHYINGFIKHMGEADTIVRFSYK